MVKNSLNRRIGLVGIGRTNYSHTGDSSHKRKILATLVGRTVLANGDAGVSTYDINVKVGITDGVSDLLI